MKKQPYQPPTLRIVRLAPTAGLLVINSINGGDTGIGYGGGGSGPAFARQENSEWGDDWEE